MARLVMAELVRGEDGRQIYFADPLVIDGRRFVPRKDAL